MARKSRGVRRTPVRRSDFEMRRNAEIGPFTELSKKTVEAARKPNSVPPGGCPPGGYDHSSLGGGCPPPPATYPGARTGRPQALPYLVLHRVGFTKHSRSPGNLVRSYRTFSPLPAAAGDLPLRQAVCFLLHFPSRRRDSTLWSTLPCGVRTFLQADLAAQRSYGRLQPRLHYFSASSWQKMILRQWGQKVNSSNRCSSLKSCRGMLRWQPWQTASITGARAPCLTCP